MSRVYQLDTNIWVGDYPKTREATDLLQNKGVRAFVSLVGLHESVGLPDYQDWLEDRRVLNLSRRGYLSEKPYNEFLAELKMIQQLSNIFPVYLHCNHGKDRSGTYAAGLLQIKYPRLTMDNALRILNESLRSHTTPWTPAPSEKAIELREFLYKFSQWYRKERP